MNSPKVKYLEVHLKQISAHRFEDLFLTNKLGDFSSKKILSFIDLELLFATAKPLIWASFYSIKNQFFPFFSSVVF